MEMKNYKARTYYTLESKTKGTLMTYIYAEYGKPYHPPIEIVWEFDTWYKAYAELVHMYESEDYNRKEHAYYRIMEHRITEYDDEYGEHHRNEYTQMA